MTEKPNNIPETTKSAPEIKTSLPELSQEQIKDIRKDVQRLTDFEKELRIKYLDSYHNINDKYPKFFNIVNNLVSIWETLWEDNKKLSNEELKNVIDKYNSYATEFNNIISKNKLEDNKTNEKTFSSLHSFANWEWTFDWIKEEYYTQEDKEELKKFAKDVWEEFFPDSNIDNFVKSMTWQEELEWYQRILLAPANWVENIITWIAALFDESTYKDIKNSYSTLKNLSSEDWEDLYRSIEFTYENLPTTNKVAPIISFIFSMAFILWWISKIAQIAQKANLSSKLVNTISHSTKVWSWMIGFNKSGKIALLWTMSGITLKNIKKLEN